MPSAQLPCSAVYCKNLPDVLECPCGRLLARLGWLQRACSIIEAFEGGVASKGSIPHAAVGSARVFDRCLGKCVSCCFDVCAGAVLSG